MVERRTVVFRSFALSKTEQDQETKIQAGASDFDFLLRKSTLMISLRSFPSCIARPTFRDRHNDAKINEFTSAIHSAYNVAIHGYASETPQSETRNKI